MNTAAAIELLVALLTQAARISVMLNLAKAEARDITNEEWRELLNENDAARARLIEAIAKARGAQ